ncbi:hypothetical protein [Marinivivus vitaminiproducens]|uniref:hypothetical protein n=1 Tax=Marinivivus vitaminiproducens TaxID=3035935 RepID=UPI0027A209FD|nr:hypothetical protein P4R82_08710 [Geminicoccaceae bacterium SCSIO 64248]
MTARAAFAVSGCPTATRPVAAMDGLLMRLLVPGGRLVADSLASFARGCVALGVDRFDITNRANLQLRGLTARQARDLAELARATSLLPSDRAERRRAIVTSPLAGLDGREQADPRPLARAVDAFLLRSPLAEALSAKAGLGIDGNGRWPIVQSSLDLVFVADGQLWQPVLAGRATGIGLPERTVLAALSLLLRHLADAGLGRVKDLAAADGLDPLVAALAGLDGAEPLHGRETRRFGRPPVGVIDTRDGRPALGAIAPFGELSCAAAIAVADLASRLGGGEVRLSPWQGVVIPAVAADALPAARAALDEEGLVTDPETPFAVLHACVAGESCPRSDAPVRADARALAAKLGPRLSALRHVHVSGCERGCAWPRPADLLLLADGGGGYELRRGADARTPGSGAAVARGLDPDGLAEAVRAQLDQAETSE